MLRKLEHDFERMRSQLDDPYAAFDFFVTARHLSEWMTTAEKKSLNASEEYLKLRAAIRDVGDSAKHFEITRQPATDSKATLRVESAHGLGPWGTGRYSAGYLVIHLSGQRVGDTLWQIHKRPVAPFNTTLGDFSCP